MFFSDPFGRPDDPHDDPLRRRARWACRLTVIAVAAVLRLGMWLAPAATEPFVILAVVVMVVAMIASYAL